ncbi:amidohydrolase [Methanotrichaceae archaeon M04Ac]|uniref:5'-deoxyadenosine deaminase n=1 Tax=Candidatus Methanocrinis alkalitolerans TaxID=3033395 RepID=A0ABT5XHD5_9EURY|nr:amidohydrolase [Candidatus Methanocrinis alkalitolerans]MCR3884537.1 amidohydrolase [Methanothrix sp.]MDF0594101.1 amidohydrolase [Candidatus Methanocrinis alkalitolerans]
MLIKDLSIMEDGRLLRDVNIAIDGSRIAGIGPGVADESGDGEVIDGSGKLAIPGLVNAHTHLAMTLFRGYADDMELLPWLSEKIWPLEAKLTAEDVRWGTKLGCLEMIRGGITCYNDMYYFMDETARATKEMGLRAFLSEVVFDMRPDQIERAEPFVKRWKGDDLIVPALGPHAVYTCSEETLLKSKEIAEKHDVMLHIHLSETRSEVESFEKNCGKSPVEYLDSIGFLSDRVVAAHCVWLSERDISIIAERGVTVAHCSISNHKLASGIAPLDRLARTGANICLGTDGASSNNSLNLFHEMKTTAIAQKCAHSRPDLFSAGEVWKMATENAYAAFGLDLGIRAGALADLALIDLQKPWFFPLTDGNILSHLVYSAQGGVDTTIVDGNVLMKGGVIPGEEAILERAQEQFLDLLAR